MHYLRALKAFEFKICCNYELYMADFETGLVCKFTIYCTLTQAILNCFFFISDYESLRIGGLVFAVALFLLGIALIVSKCLTTLSTQPGVSVTTLLSLYV